MESEAIKNWRASNNTDRSMCPKHDLETSTATMPACCAHLQLATQALLSDKISNLNRFMGAIKLIALASITNLI